MMAHSFAFSFGVLAILCALPGMSRGRFGPLPARIAALIALLALWIAALDWPVQMRREKPGEVIAVTTGEGAGDVFDDLRKRVEADGVTRFDHLDVVGSLGAKLIRARLRRPTAELLLVWDGSFDVARENPTVIDGLVSMTTAPRAMLEPEWFELRSLGSIQEGRPMALELRIDEAAKALDWRGSLAVLDAQGREIFRREVAAGELAQPVLLETTAIDRGSYRVRLEVEFGDAGRLQATGAFGVRAASLIQVIGTGDRAEALVVALRAQGLRSERRASIPESLDADGVMILTAHPPASQQARLATFVDAGGGLFLVGAKNGGALPRPNEPLHEILPVVRSPLDSPLESPSSSQSKAESEPDPPPDSPPEGDTSDALDPIASDPVEVERRSIALILVVDRSGSMGQPSRGGRSKMDDAKRSAYETASNLEVGDHLGLIAFGARDQVMLPLGSVPSDRELREALATLHAEDPRTLVAGALQLAERELSLSKMAIRHAVVITDGELAPEDVPLAKATARSMASQGITVSVIQVLNPGDAASALDVMRIAQFGQGVLHRSENPAAIPSLVFAEVKRVLGSIGRHPSTEIDFAAEPKPEPKPEPATEPEPDPESPLQSLRVFAVVDSLLLDPEPSAGYPDIHGVLPVTGRRNARVLLAAGEHGIPLLAFANRGLGRIAVWTSDFFGVWGQAWAADPQLPGRLATWVSHLQPAMRSEASALILDAGSFTPEAPTQAEWEALEAFSAEPMRFVENYRSPPASWDSIERGRAAELALWAILSIFLLAVVEFVLRRSGGPTGS